MDSTDNRAVAARAAEEANPTAELASTFAETARLLFGAGRVTDTLAKVVELAVATIEGCDFAGLFLLENGAVMSPIHTDRVVDEVDALQQQYGEGPCLDAMNERLLVYAEDLSDEPRWPRFGPPANSAGIRSVLALPLTTSGSVGALNLYASYPAAFGVVDRARGVVLATLAGLAVSTARSHE